MNKEKKIGSVNKGNEFIFIFDYFKKNNCPILYIARDDREIFEIKDKLKWFAPNIDISLYRSWDHIPFDNVSPSKDIQSERIKTLYKIFNKKTNIVLSSVNAVSQKTINYNFFKKNFLDISPNKKISFSKFIDSLIVLGYQRTSLVRDNADFAIRGSLVDIFLSNYSNPIRIDFFDEKIENIYEFDKFSQKKIQKINKQILIHSSSELLINKPSLNLFRTKFRKIFPDYRISQVYKSFSDFSIPPGGENYIPLFNDSMTDIFNYCSKFKIILNSDFDRLLEMRLENINDYYNARFQTGDKFNLTKDYLYLDKKKIYQKINKHSHVKLFDYNLNQYSNFAIKKISNISSIKKEIDFNSINNFFKLKIKNIIVICARSNGSRERIIKILFDQIGLKITSINNFNEIKNNSNIYIANIKFEESLQYKNFIFLNEKSIFGYYLSTQKKQDKKFEIFFEEINKLTKNSILVHSEYGFCRFLNIKKLNLDNSIHDCIELEFANNQKLFLPIENLNYITKYSNDEKKNINLDFLGTKHWQRRKAKIKDKIKDSAKKLMTIAARRFNSKSYNIKVDEYLYEKFSSTFPFVETDDQIKAIEDIKSDFSKPIPSDRLIVGDVAFGKTEIILRAVFLASKSKIQSLILVPTTLLSRQHFTNFTNRLSPFGIKVCEISRLINSKTKTEIYHSLKNGTIDVIIGTHALLNDKISFKKLGLIIYDEEQKLGTIQKEKFKSISPRAHVISLSATPIPRTLSLSLAGIRDLSLILTAPYERLAVRSFITPFNETTIIEAIKREIYGRKNSVFYVTPRTKDIPFIENFIKEKLPNIKYVVAHGKLNTKTLEERITKFYNQEVPILISTNIIENGLDLPHVNTIIINRSNIFSLSSLYQLKGRVGRSSKRGYAYLTYKEKDLTENARKRLNIINSFEEIGSGFNIASSDLDLRGGGSIIGEEQSGFINGVGTELYYQMLEEEIELHKQKLSNNINIKREKNFFQPTIKIPEKIYIPDTYINDLDVKISIYKRISSIQNKNENNNLIIELIDRFGQLPFEVENLFKLIEIKILCIENNIDLIEFGKKGILFSFFNNKPLNPKKILQLSISKDQNISIRPDQKIFYNFFGKLNDDRFKLVKSLIKKF